MTTPMIALADKLCEIVGLPAELSNAPEFDKMIWFMGKQKGIKEIRKAVKQNNSKPLPYMDKCPKNVVKSFGDKSDIWIKSYNSTIEIFHAKVHVMMFQATRGKAMFAHLSNPERPCEHKYIKMENKHTGYMTDWVCKYCGAPWSISG